MIFTALFALMVVGAISQPAIQVNADSSSTDSGSSSYEYIDRWEGYIRFNSRPSYSQQTINRIIHYDNTSDTAFTLNRSEFFYPVQAYYDTSFGLVSIDLAFETFDESNPYDMMSIPGDGASYPWIYARGDFDDFDYAYFYGYLPISNIPYGECSINYDNRFMFPWFDIECNALMPSMSSQMIFWTYMSNLCGRVASMILNEVRAGQQQIFEDGYKLGIEMGQATVYTQGYNAGYTKGYDNGYNNGYDTGYNVGYVSSSDVGGGFMALFGTIANVPIVILNGLGDLAIFDIPLIKILATFLVISLFALVIKKVV